MQMQEARRVQQAQQEQEARRAQESISITFVESGSLGLKFVENRDDNVVQIRSINPGTQAHNHGSLCPGRAVQTIGATSVVGMTLQET